MITAELRESIRHWHPRVAELPSGITGDYCGNCGVEWPCIQIALLNELEAAEDRVAFRDVLFAAMRKSGAA